MKDAPEKIWAMASMYGKWSDGHCSNEKPQLNDLTAPFIFEYTRTDAIIAALPDMIAPLVWDGPNCGIWEAHKRFKNDCAAYKIIWDLGRKETYTVYFGNARLGVFDTLAAAKAAANAHHVAQIMAAFHSV
jgi:hypothetical protein